LISISSNYSIGFKSTTLVAENWISHNSKNVREEVMG